MQDYNILIKKDILEKIKQFEPISLNGNKNNKGFRITKNGRDTGIFKKINDYAEILILEMIWMIILENNIKPQNNMRINSGNNNMKINIIPKNKMNEEDE